MTFCHGSLRFSDGPPLCGELPWPFSTFAKQAVHNGLEMDLDRSNHYESELFALCFTSPEQQEEMAAFLEKRPARFRPL